MSNVYSLKLKLVVDKSIASRHLLFDTMDFFKTILDFILHIDRYLATFLTQFGTWSYVLLFGIVFTETGLVIMPFLPGDSLLFVAGSLSAQYSNQLNIFILVPLLFSAALLGDNLNYFVARNYGTKISSKILKPEYLTKTHEFFEKYGAKTIMIARWIPIVRTFAPFSAGLSGMNYGLFLRYSILGGALWVGTLTLMGYFLGNLPVVKHSFEIAIYIIIIVSLLPGLYEFVKHRLTSQKIEVGQ